MSFQGQTDTAKEYLRQALSFNKLIEVSKAGLPVDMGTLPVPPQMQARVCSKSFISFLLPLNITPVVFRPSKMIFTIPNQITNSRMTNCLSLTSSACAVALSSAVKRPIRFNF